MGVARIMDRTNADLVRRSTGGARRLSSKLARSRDAIQAYFRPLLHAHGVTDPQWRVLQALSAAGELDAGETARRAVLLPSSLSRILRDFSARGLISSWVSEIDARRSMHALTPAGRKLVDEIEPQMVPIDQEIERRFGADRVRLLEQMLDALTKGLED